VILLAALALAEPAAVQTIDLVHQVEPRFPREARRQQIHHAECAVVVRVTAEGVPDDVHPTSCDDLFVEPTVSAVRRWRFDVKPPAPAVFRVVVVYDYPKKEGWQPIIAPAVVPVPDVAPDDVPAGDDPAPQPPEATPRPEP
jgi:hypothetical protein